MALDLVMLLVLVLVLVLVHVQIQVHVLVFVLVLVLVCVLLLILILIILECNPNLFKEKTRTTKGIPLEDSAPRHGCPDNRGGGRCPRAGFLLLSSSFP